MHLYREDFGGEGECMSTRAGSKMLDFTPGATG